VIKLGGAITVVVATATAVCGLLMLSGVGPSPAAADDDETVPERAAPVASSTQTTTETEPTEPAPTAPATTEPVSVAVALVVVPPSSTPDAALATPPIPLRVAPQSVTVGAGGTAQISGECPVVDGAPLGPVEIWQIGSTVTQISTGVTAATWSYDWTAPTEIEPLVLQIWCGDPSQYAGGYPESLQIEVVFVAQEAPTTTTTIATAPEHVIPETG
jgi:hypothetical protein